MKKNLLRMLFLIAGLAITGCGSSADKSEEKTSSSDTGSEVSSEELSSEEKTSEQSSQQDTSSDSHEQSSQESSSEDSSSESESSEQTSQSSEDSSQQEHIHVWGEPYYSWENDNSKCYAERKCQLDESHIENETSIPTYKVVVEPTEYDTGLGRYTATFNNPAFETQTIDVVLEVLPHTHKPGTPVIENNIDPSCLEDGSYDLVTYCIEDGEEMSREHITVKALGHDYVGVETHATYEHAGYITYTCSRCHDTYTESNGEEQLQHNYATTWSYDENKHWHNCTDAGYESLKIDEGNHQGDYVIVNPTSETDGYKYFQCSTCGYKGNNIPTGQPATGTVDKLSFILNEDGESYSVKKINNDITGKVVIPSIYNDLPVTKIASGGFSSCLSISEIIIPDSIFLVASDAFYGCPSIKKTTYDNGEYIGSVSNPYLVLVSAVNQSIESCQIHEDTICITKNAFYGCDSLKEIIIPNKIKTIGKDVFGYCWDLQTYYYGNIKDWIYLFYQENSCTYFGCNLHFYFDGSDKEYSKITIPSGITTLKAGTFNNCLSLTKLILPNDFTFIESGALSGADNIEYYEVEGAKYLGNEQNPSLLLYRATSESTGFIHGATKIINHQAFADVFDNSSSVTSITIPDSVTHIGNMAFSNCYSITTIELSKNLKYVGKDAISYYKTKNYRGLSTDWLKIVGKENLGGDNIHLYLNNSAVETTSIDVSIGTKSIDDYTYYGCVGLTSVKIPDTVISIGIWAFRNCKGLENLTLSNNLLYVGGAAFDNCSKLPTNTYDNAYYLGSMDNPYLLLLKATDRYITSCNVHSDTKIIGDCAFLNIESLASITLSEGLIQLGSSALYGTGLTSVNIPDSVTIIDYQCFAYCRSLTTINFGSGLKEIGDLGFIGDSSVTAVNYNGTVEEWGNIKLGKSWNYDFPSSLIVKCSDGSVNIGYKK